jgi:hypothetical protein
MKIQSDEYQRYKGSLIEATKTTTATLSFTEEIITLDSSGGAFTLTLPDTSSMSNGKRIWLYDNGSASTNNITIAPNGSDTIEGGTSYIINRDNLAVIFEYLEGVWTRTTQINSHQKRTITTTATITIADRFIFGDMTGGADYTATLPLLADAQGMIVTVKKISGAALRKLTIDGNGAETIDGSATVVLQGIRQPSVTLFADTSEWKIIGESIT